MPALCPSPMTESASPALDDLAMPTPVLPDRADAPVSETAERFLRGILAQVPVERIEELHLFSPLRQGTVETGIAVLAARVVAPPAPEASSDPELPLDGEVEAMADVGTDEPIVDAEMGEEPVADEVSIEAVVAESPAPPIVAPVERHTVYTARYRYVIKGPERGKWEADIKAEADAPLITVETVVRGVQRRAGEESEIVRYSGAQIARALRIPLTAPDLAAPDAEPPHGA